MNPWEATDNFTGEVKVYYDNLYRHLLKFPNNIFVETGTYIGNGLMTAIKAGFEKCYSIEIHSHLYDQACKRFSQEIEQGLVHLRYGNSETLFPEILQLVDQPATFWLDAHISSQYGEKLAKNCPIMEELTALKNHPIKTHTILIDDLNCFNNEMHDNIDIDQVGYLIKSINPSYKFDLLNAHIPNNILVAYL